MDAVLNSEIAGLLKKIEAHVISFPDDADFIFQQMRFVATTVRSSFPIVSVKFEPGSQANRALGSSWTSEERLRISRRMESWTAEGSEVWRSLQNIFGEKIQRYALLDMAVQLSQELGIALDRDAKRRKNVLIKWFEENWARIYPLLNRYVDQQNAG
jgi:hypothetical protein